MKKILNILLGVLLVVTLVLLVYACVTGGSDASISANLIWGYVLLAGAVLAVLYSAIKGMVVVVVGASVGIALSHKGLAIPNSAGGVFDNPTELVITESSIIVTYVALSVAIIVAIVSEIRNALK